MSQADRGSRSIPARPLDLNPSTTPASPRESGPLVFEPSRSPGRKLTSRLVWRAFQRHWWQALSIWLAASTALMVLAYLKVKPTYDASSTIKVDPVENRSPIDFEVFKETQVQRVTNPNIIQDALASHPELLTLPRLAQAQDPLAEVRKSLSVALIPKTNLIEVSMKSESADEAAQIVNAVIEAYLKGVLDGSENDSVDRARRLREIKQERTLAVRRKREAIAELVKKIGAVDNGQARDRNSLSIESYRVLTQQLLQTDMELVETQARLDQLRGEPIEPVPTTSPTEPDPAMVAAFYATPQVAGAQARLEKARKVLAETEWIVKTPNDPARISAQKSVDDAQRQLDVLWTRMKPTLANPRPNRAVEDHEAELRATELKATTLKGRLQQLNDRLDKLNVQSKSAGADELTLEFARQDLTRAEAVLDTVTKNLDQLEFEARGPVARFQQEYQARASLTPVDNHRVKLMAAAPVGMFLGVLGLLVLVELRSGRVHDPEDWPDRLRLNVLGVVPPLPNLRTTASELSHQSDTRSRRDLDQFLQSLDHLRVAISSGQDAWGRPRRSVLITSASGSEGKTTLAAQLAERCVNAGLLTLLIDADLRNPSLSRMFDLRSRRGLINVLRGEAMAEEAITVIGGAGGFHFLPSGSPQVDPSRLLQGDRLSRLLASARESFDLVIVDTPPVLPVPDALTIGRWVDGAILAVRFDNSRYPLIDRAHRRLAAVGVPVIGAVINGVRGTDSSYYGSYYPSHGSSDDPEGHAALEL